MPNRKVPPPIHDIQRLQLPPVETARLDNGIPVHLIKMGSQEVLKLEILFHAGRPYEDKRLVGRATSRLLREGTAHYSSAQIAEQVDFYGATLNIPINLDTSSVVLYTLSKHLEALLPLVADMLTQPRFEEEELENYIKRCIQSLQVELSKNEVVAYRTITELIFGQDHPYGYNSVAETYESLSRQDLLRHFETMYHGGNCQILLSGGIKADALDLLNRYLGKTLRSGARAQPQLTKTISQSEKQWIERPDTLQAAIRIGGRFHAKKHEDYHGFYVLNTVLGGYFGSRLMTNIREDKGYTYNIFSTVDSFHHEGCFYIGTEVGNDFAKATITEIYREINRLREDLIPAEEMLMLRNYLLGSWLSSIDGPFNVASIVRTLVVEGLSFDDFDRSVACIREISPEELRELARRYLNPEDLWEVVVGESKPT